MKDANYIEYIKEKQILFLKNDLKRLRKQENKYFKIIQFYCDKLVELGAMKKIANHYTSEGTYTKGLQKGKEEKRTKKTVKKETKKTAKKVTTHKEEENKKTEKTHKTHKTAQDTEKVTVKKARTTSTRATRKKSVVNA